jgi:hypothetical protein
MAGFASVCPDGANRDAKPALDFLESLAFIGFITPRTDNDSARPTDLHRNRSEFLPQTMVN